jgi:hypothetical protein
MEVIEYTARLLLTSFTAALPTPHVSLGQVTILTLVFCLIYLAHFRPTIMDVPFDPVLCAQLHNQLLAMTIIHIPGAAQDVRRDVLQRWLQLEPHQRPREILENSPLYEFLSLIDSYRPAQVPLTAEFMQPEPKSFDDDRYPMDYRNEERKVILLYPDNELFPTADAGLFFDLDQCRAVC